ncbi:hypothetical protein PR202_ga22315 [Eleusine coracana subsp. coracana]|uniref:Uncharacterized protein n=1 Tax=Eleusine coracana subsp. coracana TaxID=191504 RepID=A0AAV5D312_ELECO|nr:hypothetical protein PR202_ga22315 [Eleusine coracana subsp. coracana]
MLPRSATPRATAPVCGWEPSTRPRRLHSPTTRRPLLLGVPPPSSTSLSNVSRRHSAILGSPHLLGRCPLSSH